MRQGGGWDCFDLCCGDPTACDRVCPRRIEEFPFDLAEVRGFALSNVGSLATAWRPDFPRYIPVIHGGSKRDAPLMTTWAALPIDRVCTHKIRRRYKTRFDTKAEYLKSFRLGPTTRLLFLGIGKDRHLERYWRYKDDVDVPFTLARAGFDAAVAPNFSFFLDEPRTQHMHARKRSLLCATEFARVGIAPVVYMHALSRGDWQICEDFLRERHDVQIVCKEFQTGGASAELGRAKIRNVSELQQRIGRQLHLIAVGAARFVPVLDRYLSAWTVLDSVPYMRSMKRRRFWLDGGRPRWRPAHGTPIDELLMTNVAQYQLWIQRLQERRVQ